MLSRVQPGSVRNARQGIPPGMETEPGERSPRTMRPQYPASFPEGNDEGGDGAQRPDSPTLGPGNVAESGPSRYWNTGFDRAGVNGM